jgi:hypothetical protein
MGTFGKVLVGGGLLVGGYFAYEEIVKPYLAQRELERRAKALAAKTGVDYQTALAQVASLACQGVVTAETGKPPDNLSKVACDVAGKLGAIVIMKGGKLAVQGIKAGAKDIAKGAVAAERGVVGGAKAVGGAVGGTISKALHLFGIDGV